MKKTLLNFNTPKQNVRNFLIDIFHRYGFKIRWNSQFSGKASKGIRVKGFVLTSIKPRYELDFMMSTRKDKGTTLSLESPEAPWSRGVLPGNILINRKYDKIVKELRHWSKQNSEGEKEAETVKPPRINRKRKWKGTRASKALLIALTIFTTFLIFEFAAVFFVPSPDSQMSGYPGEPGWNDLSYFSNWIRNESGYDLTNICFSPTVLDTITKADDAVFLIIGLERVYSAVEVAAISRFLDRGGSIIVADDSANANVLRDEAPIDSPLKMSGLFYGDTLLSLDCDKHPKLVKTDARLPTEDGSKRYSIIFNEGTALKRVQEGKPLSIAVSSEYSWLDLNGNEDYDPVDENMYEYELIRFVEFDKGRALYIADSSIFINDMWTRGENSMFLRDSIKLLIGNNGTIIMDESIHKEDSLIGNSVNFSVGTFGFLCNSYVFIGLSALGLVGLGIVMSHRSKKIERKPHFLEVTKPILLELQDPATSFNDIGRLRNLIFDLVAIEYNLEPIFFWEHPDKLEELISDYMIYEFVANPRLFEEKYLNYIMERCNSRWIDDEGLILSGKSMKVESEIHGSEDQPVEEEVSVPTTRRGHTRAYIRSTEPVEVAPMEEMLEGLIEASRQGLEGISAEEEYVNNQDTGGTDKVKERGPATNLVDELFPTIGSSK